MNYCSHCGSPVSLRIPPEDDRVRYICDTCQTVHYQNPKIVTGCIPEKEGRILLCRRAIEPGYGWWTIPAGYLEEGETVAEGAAREALEETGARVEILDLLAVITLLHHGQVYLIYRAGLLDEHYGPTKESLEVRLFEEKDIPWAYIAFSSVRRAMKHYFQERTAGRFTLLQTTIPQTGRK